MAHDDVYCPECGHNVGPGTLDSSVGCPLCGYCDDGLDEELEVEEAGRLEIKVSKMLDQSAQELIGHLDYFELFDEINRRFHGARISYAWKNNPGNPDYNPDLGTVEKTVAGKRVVASFGLSKDGFDGPCAVIAILDLA